MIENVMTGPPRAGRREWIGLAVLALPTLLVSLDLSVLYLALPQLSTELSASSTQQLWITDVYGFLVAGFLVTMGTLGDRIGRRRLLLTGAAVFGTASVLAAYSTSAEMLIATRALLGIAGATLMPSTLALISNLFRDARQRGVAIGVWGSCFAAGATLGPVIGGTLLEFFWWGSVFLLGVPVMALLLVAGPVLLPEYRDSTAGRLDLVSVALSLAAILPVVYGLKELAVAGLGTAPVLAALAGLAFGLVFVRRQRRLTDPLLDLRLFGNRAFSVALGIQLLATVTMGGTFLFVALHLQLVDGLSPLRAGLWLVPATLAVITGSMLAPVAAQRIRPGYVIGAGLVVGAAGFGLLTLVDSSHGLVLLIVGNVVASLGIGPIGVLCTNLVVGSAPPDKAGSAASVSESSGELGIALGIAALGSIGTAVYRAQIADTLPARLPAAAAEAAGDTLAGALAAAAALPGELASPLVAAARDAFTTGLNAAAGASAITLVVFAGVAAALLRHVRPTGDTHTDQTDAVPAVDAAAVCKPASA